MAPAQGVARPADQAVAPPAQQAVAPPAQQAVAPSSAIDYAAICKAIASDIERLRRQYPQLAEYRARDALKKECWIDYSWHTHQATHRGGWSSGVPNPDPDGIWFYIGVWDPNGPDAMAQINTQPVTPSWWIGERRVTFLVLEGKQTTSAAQALLAILEQRGMITKP